MHRVNSILIVSLIALFAPSISQAAGAAVPVITRQQRAQLRKAKRQYNKWLRNVMIANAWRAQQIRNSVVDKRTALLANLALGNVVAQANALRALRFYIEQTENARRQVLAVLHNPNAHSAVRKQALKTLSYVTKYKSHPEFKDVQPSLKGYAANPNASADVRGLAMKALYTRAAGDPEIQDFLLARLNADPHPVAREGAAWALGEASHYPGVAQRLMGVVKSNAPTELRVAAMKSLFRGRFVPEVFAFIDGAVRNNIPNQTFPIEVREVAVRLSGTIAGSHRELAVLLDNPHAVDARLTPNEAAAMQRAAATALQGNQLETLQYFSRAYPGFDPLDAQ